MKIDVSDDMEENTIYTYSVCCLSCTYFIDDEQYGRHTGWCTLYNTLTFYDGRCKKFVDKYGD